jgi:glycosyltransferase involved in cell wall biosynthesis
VTAPSFLAQITPVILTYNEAANIGRCLDGLGWAKDIVVVDSGSDDETLAICAAYPQVRVIARPFDTHARQWTFALTETGVATDWVLALDADYILGEALIAEIASLAPGADTAGFRMRFRYVMLGKVLRSGLYPPVVTLYRAARAAYVQDGHTQRVAVQGTVETLSGFALHDDRKPFSRWISAQGAYARLEADKLMSDRRGARAWLRTRTPLAPLAVGLYCLIARGGLLEGPAGWLYALQRAIAEGMICAAYFDSALRAMTKGRDAA